jgi:hypothetical protein
MRDVGTWRDHSVDGGHDHGEENDKFWVVFWTDTQSCDLCQAFESYIAEFRGLKKLEITLFNKVTRESTKMVTYTIEQEIDDRGFEYVPEGNPI